MNLEIYPRDKINSQSFSQEDVENGVFQKFLNSLLELQRSSSCRIDIHISYDSYSTIVEWCDSPYDKEYGGSFQYVSFTEEEVGQWVRDNDNNISHFVPANFSKEEIEEFIESK